MANQVLVLTLPEADRLPSRYEAALPLTLAARPFFLTSSSPSSSDRVLRDQWVGCEEHAVMFDSLTDQHPIEGISVQPWKLMEMQNSLLVER
jgi:hypothetical protein